MQTLSPTVKPPPSFADLSGGEHGLSSRSYDPEVTKQKELLIRVE